MMIKKLLLELKSRFEKDRCKKKLAFDEEPVVVGWGFEKVSRFSFRQKQHSKNYNPLCEKEK